jgi:hypothetical protein
VLRARCLGCGGEFAEEAPVYGSDLGGGRLCHFVFFCFVIERIDSGLYVIVERR